VVVVASALVLAAGAVVVFDDGNNVVARIELVGSDCGAKDGINVVFGSVVAVKSHPQNVVVPLHCHDWGEQKLDGPPTIRQSESP
jgi:hypothetical protein